MEDEVASSTSRDGSSEEISEDDDINEYYNNNDDLLDSDDDAANDTGLPSLSSISEIRRHIENLEYFQYSCLSTEDVHKKLEGDCLRARSILNISLACAKLVLMKNSWNMSVIFGRCVSLEKQNMLVESGVEPCTTKAVIIPTNPINCGVCLDSFPTYKLASLTCGHMFCVQCWSQHVNFSLLEHALSEISCMQSDCNMLCPEDFVLRILKDESYHSILQQYERHLFRLSVTSHHQLRFCPGADCNIVVYAETPKSRKTKCSRCSTVFCFECGNTYHSPASCDTIRKWLMKCADDSETFNYISANTKDCPGCHSCIEKNGGCNHVQCSKCKHNFCWMCLGDWKNHGNSYYECSRYKENPLISSENQQTRAREALKKYLFYFRRWENHDKSLRLEATARERIQRQIEEKVSKSEGTWIDWQHLLKAGELLQQCRSTVQFTYPHVYYASAGADKNLFEYQQGQLEVEIEALAWKLEHPDDYSRGEIENQMDVAEKRRHTLLIQFLTN